MKQLLLTFLLLPVVLFAQEPEAIREPAVPYDFEVAVPEEKVPTYPYNRGLVLFSENGKSGYRDSLGNVIIPAVYKVLPPFNPDGYVEVAQNNSGRQRGLLDTTGRYLVPPRYQSIVFLRKDKVAGVRGDSTYIHDLRNGEIVGSIGQPFRQTDYWGAVMGSDIGNRPVSWWDSTGQPAINHLPELLKTTDLNAPEQFPEGMTVRGRYYGTEKRRTAYPDGVKIWGIRKDYELREVEFFLVEWQGRLHVVRFPGNDGYRHSVLPGYFSPTPDSSEKFVFHTDAETGYFTHTKALWHDQEMQEVRLTFSTDSLTVDYHFPLIEISSGARSAYQQTAVRAVAVRWPEKKKEVAFQRRWEKVAPRYEVNRGKYVGIEDVFGNEIISPRYRTVRPTQNNDFYLAERFNGTLVYFNSEGVEIPTDSAPLEKIPGANEYNKGYRLFAIGKYHKLLVDDENRLVGPIDRTFSQAYFPDKKHVILSKLSTDGSTFLVRLKNGKTIRSLPGNFQPEATPAGHYLVRVFNGLTYVVDERLRLVLPSHYKAVAPIFLAQNEYYSITDSTGSRRLLQTDGKATAINNYQRLEQVTANLFLAGTGEKKTLYNNSLQAVSDTFVSLSWRTNMLIRGKETTTPTNYLFKYFDRNNGVLLDTFGQLLLPDTLLRVKMVTSDLIYLTKKDKTTHMYSLHEKGITPFPVQYFMGHARTLRSESWRSMLDNLSFRTPPDVPFSGVLLTMNNDLFVVNEDKLVSLADLLRDGYAADKYYLKLLKEMQFYADTLGANK